MNINHCPETDRTSMKSRIDFLIIKILGFSVAVAVFFDATLVRLAIGPALMELGGRWNWWPGIR